MSLLSQKYPWSKWRKHVVLRREEALLPYLPDTEQLDANHLRELLSRYPAVFLKPCYGGGGRGVIQITKHGAKCTVRTTNRRFDVSYENVYPSVKPLTGGKSYIVQQGIDLISVSGRPIDFRVLLLRPGDQWELIGIMGKLAVRNQIVTNHCRGGSSIPLRDALKQAAGWEEEDCEQVETEMIGVAEKIAVAMVNKFRYVNQLGLDMAVDSQKRVWLIEANTRPQYKLFKDHEDPTLYKRIDEMIRKLRRYPIVG